jgi:hypothetical protein
MYMQQIVSGTGVATGHKYEIERCQRSQMGQPKFGIR